MTRSHAKDIAVITEKIHNIECKLEDISNKIDNKYVTVERFVIVEKIVYGLVGLLLMGVIAAILRLVII